MSLKQENMLVRLITAESTFSTQLTLGLLYALLFKMILPWFREHVTRPIINKQSFKKQWLQLNLQTFENMGIKVDRPVGEAFAYDLPGILLQHGVGGLLCVPSVFGLLPAHVAVPMALHGALFEVGWELQDAVQRLWDISPLGTPEGKAANPPSFLRFMFMHHALGLSLVVPLNVFCRTSVLVHEGVFLLQGAAFVAMCMQQLGYTLDMGSRAGVQSMRLITLVVFLIMFYSRVFRYSILCWEVLNILYSTAPKWVFIAGLIVAVPFTCFNSQMMQDSTKKVYKFWSMDISSLETNPKTKRLVRQASSEATSALLSASYKAGASISPLAKKEL